MRSRIALFLALLFPISSALACSCMPRSDEDRFAQADYVYIGIVTRSELKQDGVVESTLTVLEQLKGKVVRPMLKHVVEENWMCATHVLTGTPYVVFGRDNEIPLVDVCSDSASLLNNSDKRIPELRRAAGIVTGTFVSR